MRLLTIIFFARHTGGADQTKVDILPSSMVLERSFVSLDLHIDVATFLLKARIGKLCMLLPPFHVIHVHSPTVTLAPISIISYPLFSG